jgi:sialic acid synthase SpsE
MIYFIAEIGMNYNGNFPLCYELIRQAKYSGADIVKFQLGWRDGPGEINQLDFQKIENLHEWAKYFDIELMFSILNEKSLDLIENFKPKKIKIASRTLKDNFDLAEKIVSLKAETFISLGMWDEKEKLPFSSAENIKYLWCKSKYPTFNEDLKDVFPKKFHKDKITGYSDHSIGIEMSLLAITRGANIIEKHFTLDKSNTAIRDHTLSATPAEFRNLVNIGRDFEKKISTGI